MAPPNGRRRDGVQGHREGRLGGRETEVFTRLGSKRWSLSPSAKQFSCGMLDENGLKDAENDGVVIQVMKRKTVHMSAVARQKANQPIIYNAKA